ncbi:MAG: formylglycine-generating enzyme family protein [Planctomycetota bacterium]|nr:formylglycine-generating enzyme family protein [Planctomycetota bacterium]
MPTRNHFFLATMFALIAFRPLEAAELKGKVESVKDATITIRLESDVRPNLGERVEVFFEVPGLNELAKVATGTVIAVGGGIVEAKIEKSTGTVTPGQIAKISAAQARPKPTAKTPLDKTLTNSIGMKLTVIPAGDFLMGSSASVEESMKAFQPYAPVAESFEREQPQHAVRISKPFYLGTYEVTLGQFRQFVEAIDYKTEAEKNGIGGFGTDEQGKWLQRPEFTWRQPGFPQTDEHPVVNVSWNDAVAFCRWLSGKENQVYRLPTEAEWEYACRAGTTTRYHNGDDPEALPEVGNIADAAIKQKFSGWKDAIKANDGCVFTAPVGKFRPNAFGLYDMHGNAFEWCADWFDSRYYAKSPATDPAGPASGMMRVIRGGCWSFKPFGSCSTSRLGNPPDSQASRVGFRVARSD